MSESTSHQAPNSLHFNIELKTEYASNTEYADGSLTCRVCLQEGDIPIFDTEMTNDIVKGLLFFGAITVKADDAFPKFLCKKCYELVQGAILLRKTALESDKILRGLLREKNRTTKQIAEILESRIVSNNESKGDEESEYEPKADKTAMPMWVLKRMKLQCQKCNLSFKTYTQHKEHVISEEHSRNFGRSIVSCEPPVAEDNDDDDDTEMNDEHESRIAMEISEVKVESEIVTNEEAETKEMVFKSDEESEYELKSDETTMLRRVLKRMKLECQKCNLNFETYTQYKEHVICEEHSKSVGRSTVSCEPPVAEDNDEDDDTECAPKPDKTVKLTRFAKRKIFTCKRCDKTFKTYEQFNKHKLSEEHNKPVPCPICKKAVNPQSLRAHKRRHTVRQKQERPCICDVCGKQTKHKSTLDFHRLLHAGELPFQCAECPYRTNYKTSLIMHLRVHTGERPYPCELCPAKFVSKSNLSKHMLTHKKIRDYICDSCGKGYNSKRALEVHIRAVHYEIREHVCNICNKSYGYRYQMMKHQLSVHKRAKLQGGKKPIYLLLEKDKANQNLSPKE